MKLAKPAVRAATALLILTLLAAACGSSSETVSEIASESGSETGSETITEPESDTGSDPGQDSAVDADEDAASDADDSMVSEAVQGTAVDVGLFFDGALAEQVSTQDCTLSDGSASTCHLVTVVGYPVDNEIGPFCPSTTDTSAEEAGIWFDGDGLYDLDGEFILGLAELYNDSNWMLYDDDGNVNVTETAEAFDAAARPNVDPEYQNHCVEGRIEWLDGGEPVQSTVLLPASPTLASSSSQTRGSLGVTLNGVTIDAAAPVDAILGAYTIAAFDDCGGHINPVAGYHLHGATGCGEVEVADHAAMFGYALDGFAIHSPYDTNGDQYADLDGCGGHTTDDLGYHYHASPAAENAVIGCISGLTAQ